MTAAYVTETHTTTSSGNPTVTVPAGTQGQDILLISVECSTTSVTVSGWNQIDSQNPSTGSTCALFWKAAAGSVGSASSDVGATITVNPAASVHSAVSMTVWRGCDTTNPINDHDFTGTTTISGGTTSFTGPSTTSTVDNAVIVSIITTKHSIPPIGYTAPSGFTTRSSAVTTAGSGVADCVVASLAAGAAGNYGALPWTTDATPGTVGIFTIALAPLTTTQVIRPTTDVSSSNATGVSDNTNKFNNIDESGVDLTDWIECIASGNFITGLGSLADPGTSTGWSVFYALGLGTSTASSTWAIVLYQGTTAIESWTETVTVDDTEITHNLSSTNIANVVFTGGFATNLRLKFTLSSVS